MENNLIEITNKLAIIENQLANYKKLEEQQKTLKEELKKAMESSGTKRWETPTGIKVTLVEDIPDEMVIKCGYDDVKFQLENKELVREYQETRENYKTQTEVLQKGKKGYVRIIIPKDTEEIPF